MYLHCTKLSFFYFQVSNEYLKLKLQVHGKVIFVRINDFHQIRFSEISFRPLNYSTELTNKSRCKVINEATKARYAVLLNC